MKPRTIMTSYKYFLQPILESFASSPLFTIQMGEIFGTDNDYNLLQQSWLEANFTLPIVKIVNSYQIKGALGAYAKKYDTIYLSQELLDSGNDELITRVLLEEYGHYVDAQVNVADTAGDEGELFSLVVLGESLTPEQMTSLQTENDVATIFVAGEVVAIEQSAIEQSDSQLVWAKSMGNSNSDLGRSLAVDSEGNVYTIGRFQGTVDFDPGAEPRRR